MKARAITWRLLGLMLPFAGWMLLASLLGFFTVGSSIGLMGTAAFIIATAALHPSIAVLQVAIVGVRFFGITRGLFRYLERYVSHQVTFRLLTRLRVWFYQSLEPLAPARLMEYRSGDLLSRIVADIETLEHFYLRVIAPPLVALLVALVMLVFAGRYELLLGAVIVAGLALAGVVLPLIVQRAGRGWGQREVTLRGELGATLVDGIQGVADLVAFGRQPDQQHKVNTLDDELQAIQTRAAAVGGLQDGLFSLTVAATTVAVLALAIPMVTQARISGVTLAVLALVTIACFEAAAPLPSAWQHLEGSLAAAGRLFEILQAEPAVCDPVTPSPLPDNYALRVEDLFFRYAAGEPPALQGISFSLRPGQRLAIVGPSGSGKTTLVNLLVRFWDYQDGRIWLGGNELRQYQAEDVRRLIGVVPQTTHLFNATVRENLRVARPDASEDELLQVIEQAQMRAVIEALPQGLDTWLGEQGAGLSAGQRQRLAIARTLLRDTPIILFDEPTANLDPLVELELMRDLHGFMAGRTSLLISHRLTGLEQMDGILVMQDGRIVERGRHQDLMQIDGLYAHMWNLQRMC